MAIKIQLRRGTATEWTTANPILADGEQGHETDTDRRKIGDGVTTWNALPYLFEAPTVLFPEPYEAFETGSTALTASDQVVPMNTEVDTVAGYSLSGGGIQVTDSGDYRFNFAVGGDSTDGDRAVLRAVIYVNGVEVPRTACFGYCRNVATGEGMAGKAGKLILTAGAVVTVRARIFGDNVDTINLVSNLMLEKRA